MRYSLVSRFRGTLVGALLGESLAKSKDKQSQNWHEGWKIAFLSGESLLQQGRFDLEHWRERQRQEFNNLDTSLNITQTILATLPITLFYFENTIKLRENLLQAVEWQDRAVVRDGVLAVGYAIAQCLTEKLQPQTLIPEIISFIGETPTSLPQQLLKVHNLLQERAGLEKVQAQLSKEEKLGNTIAIAFYCFVGTLEDFRLCVLRTTQINTDKSALGGITGALSGAYNSIAGIPVTWQLGWSQAKTPEWQLTNSQMLKLADALTAAWSGVYELAENSSEAGEEGCTILQAIASPRVIRLR